MTKKTKKKRAATRQRRKIAKKTKHDQLDEFITAAASALDLKIDKSWTTAVRTHLEVTLAHGNKVASFTLPDEAEPAPVFEA